MSVITTLSIIAACFLSLMYGFSMGRQYGAQQEREKGHEYDAATLRRLVDDAAKHLSDGEQYTLNLALRKNEQKRPVSIPLTCKIQSPQNYQDQ